MQQTKNLKLKLLLAAVLCACLNRHAYCQNTGGEFDCAFWRDFCSDKHVQSTFFRGDTLVFTMLDGNPDSCTKAVFRSKKGLIDNEYVNDRRVRLYINQDYADELYTVNIHDISGMAVWRFDFKKKGRGYKLKNHKTAVR